MKLSLELNEELFQDCINIATKLFNPLRGFMNSSDYYSVLNRMVLTSGDVWTIPITLNLDYSKYKEAKNLDKLFLNFNSKNFGYLKINDC